MQTCEEFKKMNEASLAELLQKQREELRETRFLVASSQQKNVRKLREERKTIARILMVLSFMQRGGARR